jgi:hypothetical protein
VASGSIPGRSFTAHRSFCLDPRSRSIVWIDAPEKELDLIDFAAGRAWGTSLRYGITEDRFSPVTQTFASRNQIRNWLSGLETIRGTLSLLWLHVFRPRAFRSLTNGE